MPFVASHYMYNMCELNAATCVCVCVPNSCSTRANRSNSPVLWRAALASPSRHERNANLGEKRWREPCDLSNVRD